MKQRRILNRLLACGDLFRGALSMASLMPLFEAGCNSIQDDARPVGQDGPIPTSDCRAPPMKFSYAPALLQDFPELVSSARHVEGADAIGAVLPLVGPFHALAANRLDGHTESDLPEIQAWRRTFSKMGLKPTQYRSASESLLRRFRKEGTLPSIHPLVDLCNAISLAFAIPIAVFDLAMVSGDLQVRRATGTESYETFSGEIEHPDAGEVIFADEAGRAHARRWTNRQSGLSAIRPETARVLIVAEAMHETAREDIGRLAAALDAALRKAGLRIAPR
jgi:DNA/RNA-binding domain of Phe-tRNA-synthetase-like protein